MRTMRLEAAEDPSAYLRFIPPSPPDSNSKTNGRASDVAVNTSWGNTRLTRRETYSEYYVQKDVIVSAPSVSQQPESLAQGTKADAVEAPKSTGRTQE